MQILHLLMMLCLFAGCAPPSQADPARYGTVRVEVASDWASSYRTEFRTELTALSALGPAFVENSPGDVEVRHWESPNCDTAGAARYSPGTAYVEIDPVCTPGVRLRSAMGHELMHWWTDQHHWIGHICRHTGEAADCHPTIFGVALLNPAQSYGTAELGFDEAFAGDWVQDTPTEADLQLIRALL